MAKEKKVVDKIADKVVEISATIGKKAMEDELWFPATKPTKSLQLLGDATFCSTCSANTKYKGVCAVCEIKEEEIRLKHVGEINYLREKYPLYCR